MQQGRPPGAPLLASTLDAAHRKDGGMKPSTPLSAGDHLFRADDLVPCPPGCACRTGRHLSRAATRRMLDRWFAEDRHQADLQARRAGVPTVDELIGDLRGRYGC